MLRDNLRDIDLALAAIVDLKPLADYGVPGTYDTVQVRRQKALMQAETALLSLRRDLAAAGVLGDAPLVVTPLGLNGYKFDPAQLPPIGPSHAEPIGYIHEDAATHHLKDPTGWARIQATADDAFTVPVYAAGVLGTVKEKS